MTASVSATAMAKATKPPTLLYPFTILAQPLHMKRAAELARAGETIPEVEGTRPWGPRGKGSPSVSKGPKSPIQLLQLLKNRPREVKRAHFRYILGPPWSHPINGIYGARRGRSLPAPPPPVSPAMRAGVLEEEESDTLQDYCIPDKGSMLIMQGHICK